MQIAVIGGGISGLTAAYQLRQSGASVTLFEAGPRLGGAIQTVQQHGCLMEAGPDSLLVMKPAAVQLARELGLELVASVAEGPPGVVHKGRIQPLPDGFRMVAPTQLLPFVRTPLLSLGGKLRAGLEWLVPATRASEDESVADFVTRRFGREVLDTLAQPLIGGIYAADPARLDRFLTATGLSPATLRAAAGEPGFFRQILDFLMQNESDLVEFAANSGMDPARIVRLAGGGEQGGAW